MSIRSFRVPASSRAAFAFLELVVLVAVLAILAAAAVPAANTVLGFQVHKETREELSVLTVACGEYFRDTTAFPTKVADLLADPRVVGWSGPYLPGDASSGPSDYELDSWSRDYQISVKHDVLTVASSGVDEMFGSEDDLVMELNVTWIRRELTLERLKVINRAIVLYNGVHQTTNPLPADYSTIYSRLVSKGFLPTSGAFRTDAWGASFQPDPAGATPVMRVGSAKLRIESGARVGGDKKQG